MAVTEQALAKLKVPELKARCKKLKIPNFSKLSKTNLIAQIVAATADETDTTYTPYTSTSPTNGSAILLPAPNDKTPKAAVAKEGKNRGTKRDSTAGSHAQSKKAKKDGDEHLHGALEPTLPAREVPAATDLTSGAPSGPVLSTPSIGDNAQRQAVARPQIPAPRPSTARKPRSMVASTIAKPRVKPLTVVQARPTTAEPATPVLQPLDIDLTNPTDRIKHIDNHYLNRLLAELHSHRITPISGPPYPTPACFPKTATAHLAFQGLHPMLYTSGSADDFKVALRFWTARLHSYMQLGSGEAWSAQAGGMGIISPDLSTWPPITACQRIAGDIWTISTIEKTMQVLYLVVGRIGEVIGHSRDVKGDEVGLVEGCRVRADWATHIRDGSGRELPLLVKSKDTHAFPGGISKAWRATQSEGMIRLAERAVLASCALNSFSGEKMSTIAMDAAWLGRPVVGSMMTSTSDSLDIYLPEMSQVVSVHLPPDLHPSLAIVHRMSGYSEYILADTGQMVGTEDEGVVNLWQGLLGCDDKGHMDDVRSSRFWSGWEARLRDGMV